MTSPMYILRSPNIAARKIGGELMLMASSSASLYSLNDTAALLWDAADGNTSLDVIVGALCAQFDVSQDVAYTDACEVVEQLAANGI
jgi:hypothetical protein